jgi:hypothetical protein
MTSTAANRFGKTSTLIAITVIVMAIRFSIPPQDFADFDSYVLLTDYLAFRPQSEWIRFEPFSSGLMLGFRSVLGSSYAAVSAAHWLLSCTFLLVVYQLLQRQYVAWQGVLLSFGFFGALLAFVLVRATPAYLFILFGVIETSQGRTRGLVLTALAVGFHISALLAVPAVVVLFAQNRIPAVSKFFRSRMFLSASLAIIAIMAIGSLPIFLGYINIIISTFSSVIGKYSVYFESANIVAAGGIAKDTSQNHRYYMIAVTAVVLAFVFIKNENCVRLRGYVITSFIIFIFISITPVVAFRQSIFWLIPLIIIIPWNSFRFSGFGTASIIGLSLISFYLGFPSVLEP